MKSLRRWDCWQLLFYDSAKQEEVQRILQAQAWKNLHEGWMYMFLHLWTCLSRQMGQWARKLPAFWKKQKQKKGQQTNKQTKTPNWLKKIRPLSEECKYKRESGSSFPPSSPTTSFFSHCCQSPRALGSPQALGGGIGRQHMAFLCPRKWTLCSGGE